MSVVWPASLPEYVLEGGYSEQLPRNTVETEMESGLPKVRRRFTKVFRKFQATMILDQSQAVVFEAFYFTTCASGTIPFEWVHPRTRAPMSLRFTQPPPSFTPFGGHYVRVSFALLEV
jgi:hypothetical protein